MSAQNPRRIHLLGSGRHEEGKAGGAITPGHLIALANTGKYVVHPDAGVQAERLFALEDALQGKTIDDDYATNDLVGMVVASPGDVVYAFLAAGENVAIGDKLVSNGDGSLQKLSSSEIPLGIALEAMNLADSSETEDERIRVRVL